MEIELKINSPVPMYEQIVLEITKGVVNGSLPPGSSLPPIRQLAYDLELNHNTVAKAYKLLESRRITQTAGRKGTFIQEDAVANASMNSRQEAELKLRELITLFEKKGMSASSIRGLLKTQLKEL